MMSGKGIEARWLAQSVYGVRLEWGPTGAASVARDAAALLIVDVLSFTTAVSVAADRGTAVYPFPWRDDRAVAFAKEKDAALAVGRRAASRKTPWTLSPASLRGAPAVHRLVLPSPNGSSISASVDGSLVVAGCLRNADATADWLARFALGTPERPLAVIAAGERHVDGSLRPALEDLLGAGAIISGLMSRHHVVPSPEAAAAAACAQGIGDLRRAVVTSVSGRELAESGFGSDVEIATELDSSGTVTVMVDGAFVSAAMPQEMR